MRCDQTLALAANADLGRPLPPWVRRPMEMLFAERFGSVRIHEGRTARRQGAFALAFGEHVFLPRGFLRPSRRGWRFVLAHELAHVVQARLASAGRSAKPASEEREATIAGLRAEARLPITVSRSGPRRRGSSVARAIKLSMATNGGVIDATQLCAIIDGALTQLLTPNVRLAPRDDKTYAMANGKAWLDGLCQFGAYGTEERPTGYRPGTLVAGDPPSCSLALGRSIPAMTVEPLIKDGKKVSERLNFTPLGTEFATGSKKKEDLNYLVIGSAFRKLVGTNADKEKTVAGDMLMLMMGADVSGYTAGEKEFLAGMVALMFGVEATRFPSSLATSVMLLDLIRSGCTYGREGAKRFTLGGAFDRPDGRSFDHGERYGGKYPCAVHTPGPENASNRRTMGKIGLRPTASGERDGLQDAALKLNHRFIVPRREVSLFVNWIEANTPDGANLAALTATQIQTLLRIRLQAAYSNVVPADKPPLLAGQPRKDTGQHIDKAQFWTMDEIKDGYVPVFWYEGGKYFHMEFGKCKLVSDRVKSRPEFLNSYSPAKRPAATSTADRMGEAIEGTVLEAKQARKAKCPFCII